MLNISYASDDNYAPYLGISLVSLLKNNSNDFNEINIFILNSNISEKNIKKLKTIEKSYPFAKLIFIDVENIEDKLDVELQKFKVKDNVSLANYSRLFLSSLIPKNINKIIYLDCDTLILNSLKPLWQINIDNYLGAGVLALNGLYSHKKEIGLKKDDPYINSGMILINLEKWRNDNLEEKFIETILKFSENKVEYGQDQGIINAVMKDEMLVVNPKYNLEGSLHNTSWNITTKLHSEIQYNYYTKQTLDNAINNPTVMHFCVGASEHYNRPWLNKHHENLKLYKKYYNMTPFNENEFFHFKPTSLIKRFNRFLARNKITSWLIVKLLPDNFAKNIVKQSSKHENLKYNEDVERW